MCRKSRFCVRFAVENVLTCFHYSQINKTCHLTRGAQMFANDYMLLRKGNLKKQIKQRSCWRTAHPNVFGITQIVQPTSKTELGRCVWRFLWKTESESLEKNGSWNKSWGFCAILFSAFFYGAEKWITCTLRPFLIEN